MQVINHWSHSVCLARVLFKQQDLWLGVECPQRACVEGLGPRVVLLSYLPLKRKNTTCRMVTEFYPKLKKQKNLTAN
jgi:hypothetical protein